MQSNLSIETSLRKNALLAIATIMLAGSLTGCNKA